MAGWKNFECQVRDLLDLEMTTREWATTSGVPQPNGDLHTAGTWLDGLHVECKRRKNLSVPAWTRHTEQAAAGEYLIVAKRWGIADIGRSYVITDLTTVKRWLREGYRP